MKHKEFWRMERKEYAIAIIIVAIIFMPYAVSVIKMFNSETISEESYLRDILMASVDHLQEISKRLLHIESSPTLLENDKELCTLIDKQMETEKCSIRARLILKRTRSFMMDSIVYLKMSS